MRVIIHADAEADVLQAARYYQRQIPSLGAEFLDATALAGQVISEAPERWSLVEGNVRRYLMPRFPYAMFYHVFTDHISIIAFHHHSRNPEHWRDRLSE